MLQARWSQSTFAARRLGATISIALVAAVLLLAASGGSSVAEERRFPLDDLGDGSPLLVVELLWGRIDIVADDVDEIRVDYQSDSTPDRGDSIDSDAAEPVRFDVTEDGLQVSQSPVATGQFRGIDLLVTVPLRCDIDLTMLRGGEIVARGVTGETIVTNHNGSVVLTGMGGMAIVNAANGSIHATYRSISPEGELRLVTLNGEIALCLPEDTRAEVELSTRSDALYSDFPLSLKRPGDSEPPWRLSRPERVHPPSGLLRGHLGGAAGEGPDVDPGASLPRLHLATLNGEIRLEACISP